MLRLAVVFAFSIVFISCSSVEAQLLRGRIQFRNHCPHCYSNMRNNMMVGQQPQFVRQPVHQPYSCSQFNTVTNAGTVQYAPQRPTSYPSFTAPALGTEAFPLQQSGGIEGTNTLPTNGFINQPPPVSAPLGGMGGPVYSSSAPFSTTPNTGISVLDSEFGASPIEQTTVLESNMNSLNPGATSSVPGGAPVETLTISPINESAAAPAVQGSSKGDAAPAAAPAAVPAISAPATGTPIPASSLEPASETRVDDDARVDDDVLST